MSTTDALKRPLPAFLRGFRRVEARVVFEPPFSPETVTDPEDRVLLAPLTHL